MGVAKPRCSGTWTEAYYTTFIKNQLRQASRKWKPNNDCVKYARVSRGIYLCAECKEHVPKSVLRDGKRSNNICVDHIKPIVDPNVGFTTWDSFIEELFSELDNLQLLCHDCHKIKSGEERTIATKRRAREKNEKQV